MQMEPQVSSSYEANTHPDNIRINECGSGDSPSAQKLDEQQPVSTRAKKPKKPTRQWAAWTRQEEEMFFNALRQFGKNFEKITNRVPSKNKDQVRHYYYRLQRRMNKLLGPEVRLDPKNSKDTNAAMLRWWTLLEKFSCKSSKLHLKPRRFKIFLETLENQLLKDRKKHKRKRPSQRENCSPTTPIHTEQASSDQDGPAVRLVLVDSQNIQQSNSGKDVPVKKNLNIGINRKNCKSESFTASTVRQKKKPATTSKAAYKRWEKAAIAGVSLVADAAEHLERTSIDKEIDQVQGQIVSDPAGGDVPSCSAPSPNSFVDNSGQTSAKLKLQLFPIDEGTRKALEMDTHNPHLELTLSTRKKISSVLEHLHRKWGDSSVASGQLMLFPYYAQSDNLAGYLRWTQDSVLSAAEVYALIGSPPLFRLRYGWCSNAELTSATFQAPLVSSGMISNHHMTVNDANEHNKNQMRTPIQSSDCQSSHLTDCLDKDQQPSREKPMDVALFPAEVPNELSEDDMRPENGHPLSAKEWVDTLTNISVGDLLSDLPHNINNAIDPTPVGSSQPQQGLFSCDSFDAAIAAHIYRHQNKTTFTPAMSPFEASIWEAEETCDAFSFQKSLPCNEVQGTCGKIGGTSLSGYGANVKGSLETEVLTDKELVLDEPMYEFNMGGEADNDNSASESPVDQWQSDPVLENSQRNNTNALADMFWPDSLGSFDLDIPTSKHHNEHLILSDSLSSFSRLLGNLDTIQNCSFFGSDKKQTQSGVEGQEAPSFPDYKIGNGVTDFAKA